MSNMAPSHRGSMGRSRALIWMLLFMICVLAIAGMKYGGVMHAAAASIPTNEKLHHASPNDVQVPLIDNADEKSTSLAAASEAIEWGEKVSPLNDEEDIEETERHGNMLSLVGGLKECENTLLQLTDDMGSVHRDGPLTVNEAHLASCRGTISTLIRLLETQRTEPSISIFSVVSSAPLPKDDGPRSGVPWDSILMGQESQRQLVNDKLLQQRQTAMAKPMSAENQKGHERVSRCTERVCDVKDDLPSLCSGPIERMKPGILKLCTMCYPRNEDLIAEHCEESVRSTISNVVIVGGILLVVYATAAILKNIARHIRKRNSPAGWLLDHPGSNHPKNSKAPEPPKGYDEPRQRRVPVMPQARSSSVQLPFAMAASASYGRTEADVTSNRFPFINTRSHTPASFRSRDTTSDGDVCSP